jgi:hypothetical protein
LLKSLSLSSAFSFSLARSFFHSPALNLCRSFSLSLSLSSSLARSLSFTRCSLFFLSLTHYNPLIHAEILLLFLCLPRSPTPTHCPRPLTVAIRSIGYSSQSSKSHFYDLLCSSLACFPLGGVSWSTEGVLRTPGFPSGYPELADCSHRIHAMSGASIRVHRPMMDVQYDDTCARDYLTVCANTIN